MTFRRRTSASADSSCVSCETIINIETDQWVTASKTYIPSTRPSLENFRDHDIQEQEHWTWEEDLDDIDTSLTGSAESTANIK